MSNPAVTITQENVNIPLSNIRDLSLLQSYKLIMEVKNLWKKGSEVDALAYNYSIIIIKY